MVFQNKTEKEFFTTQVVRKGFLGNGSSFMPCQQRGCLVKTGLKAGLKVGGSLPQNLPPFDNSPPLGGLGGFAGSTETGMSRSSDAELNGKALYNKYGGVIG